MNRAEQYQIFIDNNQQGSEDDLWVRLVIVSALLVAKQHNKESFGAAQKLAEQAGRGKKHRPGQRFAIAHGDMTFEI